MGVSLLIDCVSVPCGVISRRLQYHVDSPWILVCFPGSILGADVCYCNTVGYSLFSACAACQGGVDVACVYILSFSTPALAYVSVNELVDMGDQLHKDSATRVVSSLQQKIYCV
jgi:hypothetical protein